MALSFAKAGASYIAVGARSEMSQLSGDIEAAALSAHRAVPKFLPIKLDVTSEESVSNAATEVDRKFGNLDILINNAGILGKGGLLEDTDPTEWWQVLEVNTRGPYLVTRAFLPLILKGGSKYIINVASVGAHLINPGLSSYHLSKAATLRLTELTNAEYAPQGVTTFAIHPGNVLTDIVGDPEVLVDHLKPGMHPQYFSARIY